MCVPMYLLRFCVRPTHLRSSMADSLILEEWRGRVHVTAGLALA
jgi:hypothetical protein